MRNEFFEAYVDAALWSSLDNDGEPLENNYLASSIDPESLDKMLQDCIKFQNENAEMLEKAGNDGQNGHDFWLTRNGHGAGFWDRGYAKVVGDALTAAAHAFGESNLLESEDGTLFIV